MDAMMVSESPAVYGNIGVAKLRMTLAEFDVWYLKTDETVHAEWANGEAVLKMPVNTEHDGIEGFLIELFRVFVRRKRLGRIYGQNVQIRMRNIPSRREPDLMFVKNERLDIDMKTYLNGPPDLAVEIVSPDSIERDHEEKLTEYEAGGIREYWLIDPLDISVAAYALNNAGKYEQITVSDGKIASRVLLGFYVRSEWLWNAQDLDPNELVAEMGAQ